MAAHESCPELSDAELENIVDIKDASSTKKVIQTAVETLKNYCVAKGLDHSAVEQYSSAELVKFLRRFYAEVRTATGNFYAKKSMQTMRYGLQKHFKKLRQIDIIKDQAFEDANGMFVSMLIKIKTEGKGAVRHKEPIHSEDMEKIQNSDALDQKTPQGLQNKVFIDIMLHMCNGGRETLREMTKDDFEVKSDATTNRRYVCRANMAKDCLTNMTKNHRTDDDTLGWRMHETPDNPQRCPVLSFEKYLSVLNPNCDAFWQRPHKIHGDHVASDVWYDNMPLGKNKFYTKMSEISLQAKCSRHYTNHCLRATDVTILDAGGCWPRHITTVSLSGHRHDRSEASVRSYSRTGEDEKRKTSQILSAETHPNCNSTAICSLQSSARPTSTDQDPGASTSPSTASEPDVQIPVPRSPQMQLLSSSQKEAILILTNSPRPGFGQVLNIRLAENSKPLRSCLGFHGWRDVRYSAKLVRDITGVSVDTFNLLLGQLPETLPVFGSLTTENGLLAFLMKLKMDTPFRYLAAQLSVAQSTIEHAFMVILHYLADLTSCLIQWPQKSVVQSTLPPFIKRSFPQCRLVVDCLEIETEAPSELSDQLPLRSASGSSFKAKALIGLTPSGYVCFISKVFSGSISQGKLSKESSLQYCLDSGDEVLSLQRDQYFSTVQGISVHTAPIWPQYAQHSRIYREDAVSLNSHLDMLKQRLRTFEILRSKMSLSLLPHVDSLVHICAVLSNLEVASTEDV